MQSGSDPSVFSEEEVARRLHCTVVPYRIIVYYDSIVSYSIILSGMQRILAPLGLKVKAFDRDSGIGLTIDHVTKLNHRTLWHGGYCQVDSLH